ncbi:MAG: Flp pilus assembly complex ATPase component TadA [Oscillospiraceae bacterium]|nr:Flp pilus assembly complex ATPase component TadA [Candidatus Equicaccousia limihippi]
MSENQTKYAIFDNICKILPSELSAALLSLPEATKAYAEEIRIRKNLPVYITVGGANIKTAHIASPSAVEKAFICLCGGAPYSHTAELEQGFITTKDGIRVGVCGTAVVKGGEVQFFKDITSLDIRIPRNVQGAADNFFKNYGGGSALIYGAPGSGKTTVLKDIIPRLNKRVAVIDTRRELYQAGGEMADYLLDVPKAEGIVMAIKSLFPQVIVFDEISTIKEAAGVLQGFNCGVPVITTAHAISKEELFARPAIKNLIQKGAIDYLYPCEDFRGKP